MHYYKFNIADYRKDTAHLTPIEHYIYRSLIDWYYLDEKPIPKITQSVMRRLGLGCDMEPSLQNVLQDFFFECENGWNHKRIEQDIFEYNGKCDKNRGNGKHGGRPKKTQSVNFANRNESENNPNVTLTINHKPLTNIKKEKILKEKNPSFVFTLPDWIDKSDWELWIKSRKKKMLPEQMQRQVNKLRKWKAAGNDHAGALQQAAENGYTGLFLPDSKQGKFQSAAKTRLDEFDCAASEFLADGKNPLLGASDG